MKRRMLSLLVALPCLQAHAIGRLADVSLVDRNTGNTLTAYYHRGEYWVAGVPGARYSIAIRNQSGERLLAVTAVDGVNVISGQTAAWLQTGYVYYPTQRYEITGWRKSDDEVAAFEFSAAPDSYAARTGRAANIGVIGVALFRERQPLPPPVEVAPAAAADMAQAPKAESARAAAGEGRLDSYNADKKLGTGHGERETSHVDSTDFERAQDTPNEVIRIRYDSLDNLMAMGVIARPRWSSPTPNPFPASPLARYVPDPPGLR